MRTKNKSVLQKGIIVSIQGYSQRTTQELADNAVAAGAVAIRTDKPIRINVPIIGLNKVKVTDCSKYPYITPDVELIDQVATWANYVAIDYRLCNTNLQELAEHCQLRGIQVVADIGHMRDYRNIRDNGYYYTYIATTMSVYHKKMYPEKEIVRKIGKHVKYLIAEGNYRSRRDVQEAFELGAHNVCIGGAISDVYKLTRKYVTLLT